MSLEFVKRWYESIPPFQRLIPLVPLGNKIYSPVRVLEEVEKGTDLGQKLQEKLETGSFTTTEDLVKIAEKRLEWVFTHLPKAIDFNTFTLGGEPITKEQLLQMIRERKGIGKKLLEQEIQNVKRLLE